MLGKRSFALLALVTTLIMIPAASAKTLRGIADINYNDWGAPGPNHPGTNFYWKGTINGDVKGTCYFWETDRNYVVGKTDTSRNSTFNSMVVDGSQDMTTVSGTLLPSSSGLRVL